MGERRRKLTLTEPMKRIDLGDDWSLYPEVTIEGEYDFWSNTYVGAQSGHTVHSLCIPDVTYQYLLNFESVGDVPFVKENKKSLTCMICKKRSTKAFKKSNFIMKSYKNDN